MKKLISILLIAISVSMLALIGCGDDGFVEVYSVSYGSTTITSRVHVEYSSEYVEITEDEWRTLKYVENFYISKDKRLLDEKVGDILAGLSYDDEHNPIYLKCQIESITYDIVKVKFLTDREYEIKTVNGKERITSDSFKVVYFN